MVKKANKETTTKATTPVETKSKVKSPKSVPIPAVVEPISVKKAHKTKAPLNEKSSNLPESDIVTTEKKNHNSVIDATPSLDADLNELYTQKLAEVEEKLKLKKSQILSATTVLKKIIDQKYKNNFDLLARKEDEFLYLNFLFNKLPIRYSIRPTPVEIPNEIFGKKYNTRVCIIVKDPRSDFKDLNLEFPFTTKVFDLEKLRLKYARFNERRNLLKEFDLFICDSRVYMVLKRFLGKPFFASKKYPIPVHLNYTKPEEIKEDLTKLVSQKVAFYMTHGPNYSIKAARIVMENEQIVNNIINVTARTVSHILKWGVDLKE